MNKTTTGAFVTVVVVVAVGWYILSGHTANLNAAMTGVNDTVATVNGTSITRSQLIVSESQFAAQQGLVATSTAVQAQFQSNALDSLIGMTLLEQAAQKAGIIASSTEIDARLASTKAQFSTQAEYDKALTTQGMTEVELRTQISRNLVINSYLDQQLHLASTTATSAEIQSAYKQIASQQTGTTTPPLSQVRDQVAQMVVQQKQQTSVNAYVTQLRSGANIQILIATSTPAV